MGESAVSNIGLMLVGMDIRELIKQVGDLAQLFQLLGPDALETHFEL